MTAAGKEEIETPDNNETSENDIGAPLSNNLILLCNENNIEKTEKEHQIKKLHEIFKNLSENSIIVFKSQQIDDPEISVEEKFEIAENLFKQCHVKFLRKFGSYLTKEHLIFLQEIINDPNEDYETDYLFKKFLSEIDHRHSNIKNRRFTVMKKMILEQNEYFSETEMMKREPLLYEQLVGQYLTETEKNVRDGFNPNTNLFSQILLENYDRDQYDKLRKEHELVEVEMEKNLDDEEESTCESTNTKESFSSSKIAHKSDGNISDEEMFPKIPPSYKKLWGDFDDENSDNDIHKWLQKSKPSTSISCSKKLCSISKVKRNKLDSKQKYVTAGEREMLRQEFLSIMRSKFVNGSDKDFDYTNIDNNTDLDDLEQINQDCEDKYFEEDDLEDHKYENRSIERFDDQNESEDDLDIYMKGLNKVANQMQKF
ncbi:coiled-coil domain-containing protein 97 [Condylostylus longicornis]|uniref:coiled-coil domain-containing protein 97 n=1 Tax=Condylostylus longicornis TaxID=2530218 RepID=UPI00244DA61D|nr:coiled-coil domain-containing protein 97 [Condylostylus longicornis]